MKQQFSLIILLLLSVTPTIAQEPCEQFLNALRERGYHDVALDYLEEMQTSPLASSVFKASIPFEKAQTLISSTARIRDLKLLNERLEQAEQLLAQAESNSDDPALKAKAQDFRGDLLFRRARSYMNRANNDRATAAERAANHDQARELLGKALDAVTTARESYKKLVDEFELDLRDSQSRRQQKLLRATYTVVRVKRPQILEMYADTLKPDDADRNTSLELAATEFEKLWDAYPNYPAGLDSCLYAARCNHKLDRNKKALELVQQIFALPKADALRKLKLRAMVLASDCWAATEPYPFDRVIANLEPHASNLTRRQQRIEDWQRIQIELARAYRAKAARLKEQGGDSGRIKNLNRDAAKMIKALARAPGQHRAAARELSAAWNIKADAITAPVEIGPIKTFAQAKRTGSTLLAEIQAVSSDVSQLNREFRRSGESDSQLKQQLTDAENQLNDMATRCLQLFDRALVIAEPDVVREDINQVRYSQCVCRYVLKQHYESALIGEFLVDRYPTVQFSRQAAGIALRSCAALQQKADESDGGFERRRLNQLAEKVVETWPGSSESNYAASTITKLILAGKSVSDEEIELARNYIEQVSDSSPERSSLNIKLGNKLWFVYKNRKAAGSESQLELTQRLNETIDSLRSGLLGVDASNLSMESAWASLFQVDALLEAGKVDQAIEQLELSANAPRGIVDRNPPVLSGSKNSSLYVGEVYKIAGKAYMAAMGKEPEESKWIGKASEIVRAMSERASTLKNEAAKKDVTNMFRLIASQMQRQFDLIDDDAQLQSFSANLHKFLYAIQAESKDANTLIWAGRTLMKLADSFATRQMKAEAKPLYNSAIDTLEKAASLGSLDEKIASELKRQQALAKRGLGQYEEAFTGLLELLKASPSAWNIQIDAADTLQRWGAESKQGDQLARALSGTERFRDPKTKRTKNLVWGWSQLVSAFKANPKYREPYYRCLFAEVETRLEYGLVAKKKKAVESAFKRLEIAKTKDKELGGEIWKRKFEKLEARIRKNGGAVAGSTKTSINER